MHAVCFMFYCVVFASVSAAVGKFRSNPQKAWNPGWGVLVSLVQVGLLWQVGKLRKEGRGGRAREKKVGVEIKHAQASPSPSPPPSPSFVVCGASVLLRSCSSHSNLEAFASSALQRGRIVDLGVWQGFLQSCVRLCR